MSPVAKVTEEQVLRIRQLCNVEGMTTVDVASMFNISPANVSSIASFGSWQHIGGEKVTSDVLANKKGVAKLNEVSVREIRSLADQGEKHALIASRYGVSRKAITLVVNRTNWKHVE